MNVKPVGTLLVQATSESMLPKEKLEQLVGEPDSGIEKVKQVIHVAIHPRYASNVGLGVMNSLNKLINSWHPQLNGILAGYGKLQLKKPTGTILNEEAYFHIDVQSDFWLFRPLTGQQLKGIVTKKSDKHVSVLVHGIFNIPCLKPNNLNKDWWGVKARLKCPAHLTVLSTDMTQKVPQIMGDLQNIGLDGTAAQKINFDETVPSPEVVEYSDDDWSDVIKATASKKVQKSPTKKVKKIISSSNSSSGASSESEESEPARNNHQVKSVSSHLQSSEDDDSKDSNQKKNDSSDETSEEEEKEATKIVAKVKISSSPSKTDLKTSPTKNSNENTVTTPSKAAPAGKRKPPVKFTEEQKSTIIKEVVEKLISPTELSKKYGTTPKTIRTWVTKAGFDLPKPNAYKKSTTAAAPSKKPEIKEISSNNINSIPEKPPNLLEGVNDILMKLEPVINKQLPSPKKSPSKSSVKPKLENIIQSPLPISKTSIIPSQESSEDDTETNKKANDLLSAVLKNNFIKKKKKKKSSKKEKYDEDELLESPPSKKSKMEVVNSPTSSTTMFSSQDPELDDQREKYVSKLLLDSSNLLNDDTKNKKKSKKEKHHHEKTEEEKNLVNDEPSALENNADDGDQFHENFRENDLTKNKKNKKKKKERHEREQEHDEKNISTPTKRKPETELLPEVAPSPSKKSKKSRLSFDTSTPINVANQFSFNTFPAKIDHSKMNDSGLDHSLDESSSKPKKKKKDKKEKKDK